MARVGLIDFQDAVAGSRAYDLISLIEDARRDVSPELAEIATAHYLAAMRAQGTPLDEAQFPRRDGGDGGPAQRQDRGHFRPALCQRDGKRRYLAYLPRVWALSGARPAAIPRWPICGHGMIASFPKTRRTLAGTGVRVIRRA